MTIKRKRTNSSGLVEVECDSTDTVDTNGTSDGLSAVGGKTAKFSDNTTMKANSGLKLGILQVLIAAAAIVVRSFSLVSGVSSSQTAGSFGIWDTGSIATSNIHISATNFYGGSSISVVTGRVAISDDNVTYTEIGTFTRGKLVTATSTFNNQTFRYVKITNGGSLNFPWLRINSGTETVASSQASVRLRSSTTQDGANGTVLKDSLTISPSTNTTLNTELFLTGAGEYFTLEIVSFTGVGFSISLNSITSIREET